MSPHMCNLLCVLITGTNLFRLGGRFKSKNYWKDKEAQVFIDLVAKVYSPWELIAQIYDPALKTGDPGKKWLKRTYSRIS